MDTAIRIDFTLCRGCALYPHHGAPDLVIPFGWTSIAPTKPACPVTLPSYHRQSSSPGVKPWVAPVSPHDTCHHRGQTKLSQMGTTHKQPTGLTGLSLST